MKTLIATLIFAIGLLSSFHAQAEETVKPGPAEKGMHDMHIMARMMNQGLCTALEGANLMMLGQMEMSEKMDKDLISQGAKMINDGKTVIKDIVEDGAMKKLHKQGEYEHRIMDALHGLGMEMLQVIEKAENLNERIHKPGFEYLEKTP